MNKSILAVFFLLCIQCFCYSEYMSDVFNTSNRVLTFNKKTEREYDVELFANYNIQPISIETNNDNVKIIYAKSDLKKNMNIIVFTVNPDFEEFNVTMQFTMDGKYYTTNETFRTSFVEKYFGQKRDIHSKHCSFCISFSNLEVILISFIFFLFSIPVIIVSVVSLRIFL